MYKGVRMFPKPDSKVLFKFHETWLRLEVIFTKSSIYIFDFMSIKYMYFRNVNYDIYKIDIRLLLSKIDDFVSACPQNVCGDKFLDYMSEQFNKNYNLLHHEETC